MDYGAPYHRSMSRELRLLCDPWLWAHGGQKQIWLFLTQCVVCPATSNAASRGAGKMLKLWHVIAQLRKCLHIIDNLELQNIAILLD